MRAFLERQEMKITNMEAVGIIRPGSIQVTGGLTTPAAPGTCTAVRPCQGLLSRDVEPVDPTFRF